MEQAIEIIELREELHRTKLLLQNCNGDIIRADRELASLREQLKDAKQEIANLTAIGSLMVDGDVEVNLANEVYKLKGELKQKEEVIRALRQDLEQLKHENTEGKI